VTPPGVETADRPHVLVVEDNEANALLAVRQLDKLGLLATVAPSRDQALEHLERRQRVSLVLMDLHIGGDNGLELTREIRRSEQGRPDRLPIIAMTASVTEHDRAAALGAGMDGFLTKPVFLEALQAELARWLAVAGDTGDRPKDPSAADAPESGGVIDPRSLERMRLDIGDTAARRFVELYTGELRGRVAAIRKAVDDGNRKEIEQRAHALRSPSAAVGAERLALLCEELENFARDAGLVPHPVEAMARAVEALERPTAQALEVVMRERP
jgi:CheY-like chemotaxis protein/HPt (histidine-containing phosphotransfer) domain-containing protein